MSGNCVNRLSIIFLYVYLFIFFLTKNKVTFETDAERIVCNCFARFPIYRFGCSAWCAFWWLFWLRGILGVNECVTCEIGGSEMFYQGQQSAATIIDPRLSEVLDSFVNEIPVHFVSSSSSSITRLMQFERKANLLHCLVCFVRLCQRYPFCFTTTHNAYFGGHIEVTTASTRVGHTHV